MIITDSAKKALQEALAESNNDCLQVKLQKSCCGTSLFFQMGKLSSENDQSVRINEIPIVMDEEITKHAADVTLDYKDEQLVIIDPKASGCC